MPQISAQVRYLTITPQQAGQRVDNFLLRELRDVPRSHVYRLLRSGQVRVNGGRVKPTRRLDEGDELRLPPVRYADRPEQRRVPDAGRAELLAAIIHEDADLLVLNKPAGWAVHAGSRIPYGIIEGLRQARAELDYLELAHRLDRETSGCLLLAKNRAMLEQLHAGLREHDAGQGHEKIYLALLGGQWRGGSRTVDLPLADQQLESGERMVQTDPEQGRAALSEFCLQEQFADCCLAQVRIATGRMHQIRVHAQAIGHPVVGDSKYGDRALNQSLRKYGARRTQLHAHSIRLKLADGERLFTASLPEDMQNVLRRLRDA